VVQFGAVSVDAASLAARGEFMQLVRPRINPVLSDYFIELTGITNARLEADAVDFETAYTAFRAFLGKAQIFAYGRDDLVLAENLELYGLDAPLARARDIRPWLEAQGIDSMSIASGEVAKKLGLKLDLQAHDALDDCRSVVAAVRHLVAAGAPNPFDEGL
jgi:inhibitor of KinA sporulation pathway (predicted exonuclease)